MANMKVVVSSDNIELSESMKALANQKLEKFIGHVKEALHDNSTIRVVLNTGPEDTFVTKIEVELVGMGKSENERFFTEGAGFEFETSIVNAVDEIDRQYLKFKEKNEEIGWKEKRDAKFMSEEDLENLGA